MDEKILQFLDKNYEEKLNAMLAAQESINKTSKPAHKSSAFRKIEGKQINV